MGIVMIVMERREECEECGVGKEKLFRIGRHAFFLQTIIMAI